jgi:hypothetical protein
MLWFATFTLGLAAGALLVVGGTLLSAAISLNIGVMILFLTSMVLIGTGITMFIGSILVYESSVKLYEAGVLLMDVGSMMYSSSISILESVPLLEAAANGLITMSDVLTKGAFKMLTATLLLRGAVNGIVEYTAKMQAFADPMERVASAFEKLANSVALMRDAVTGLASLPLSEIFSAFNSFSPTEEALDKVERLSLALEKIGREYAQAISDETRIAAELTKGKTTTESNPAKETEENPIIKTNNLLTEAKDTLDSILDALKPGEKAKFTSFGVSLFNSPRGFEI